MENLLLHLAARLGYADSQYHLGRTYYRHQEDKAVYWFKKAAKQGHAKAQFEVGNAYYWGRGAKKNYDKAAYWYQLAADNEHKMALFQLGWLYYSVWKEKLDVEKGLYLMHKAAEKCCASAQFNLGAMYFSGNEHIKQDKSKGIELLINSVCNNPCLTYSVISVLREDLQQGS